MSTGDKRAAAKVEPANKSDSIEELSGIEFRRGEGIDNSDTLTSAHYELIADWERQVVHVSRKSTVIRGIGPSSRRVFMHALKGVW